MSQAVCGTLFVKSYQCCTMVIQHKMKLATRKNSNYSLYSTCFRSHSDNIRRLFGHREHVRDCSRYEAWRSGKNRGAVVVTRQETVKASNLTKIEHVLAYIMVLTESHVESFVLKSVHQREVSIKIDINEIVEKTFKGAL